MSSHSDSDEFFDAEDTTPVRTIRLETADSTDDKKNNSLPRPPKDEPSIAFVGIPNTVQFPVLRSTEDDIREAERKAKDNERRRRRVEEQRKRMLNDEDEVSNVPSEQSSLASSVEAVYPVTNSLNPSSRDNFGLNGEESRSVISLGKVGSILGDKDSLNTDFREPDTISTDTKYSIGESESSFDLNRYSKNTVFCPEPDVVASTKGGSGELLSRPVRPPRKKKNKKAEPLLHNIECPETDATPELPSPTDPVESLARELECSLDIRSATRGQYVVKPQDREQDRAEGPTAMDSGFRIETGSGLSPRNTHKSPESESNVKKDISDSPQPYIVRTRSDSGRPLTDQEILAQVTVRNLDTGEQIPLSLAEEHLPKCVNPLSLQIMRITSEYISHASLEKERESDEESIDSRKQDMAGSSGLLKIRKGIGRRLEKTVHILKSATAGKSGHIRHGEEEVSEEEILSDVRPTIKIKVSSSHKKMPSEFEKVSVVQELSGEHSGAIWTMKFSSCGRLLATAGQDHDLRIWVLKDACTYFGDMRQKYNAEGKSSPTPSQENISASRTNAPVDECSADDKGPFLPKPFCRYKGHTAELLDVSWSKNYFILSSSMDKTVRLWHISRQECLCCFQHIDFVTAIAFHPRDDRYFLSGSLDGKLRLWNIPDKKVTLWNELDGQTKLITAVNFCQNGKIAVVGSYDGRCIFYNTEQLKYYTQLHVRSTRGKNAQGRKISGIEAMPGEDKILITSNDSRIRLYDLRDLSLSCKYKGYVNLSSQIKASFSHDGKYVISGSENQFIYLWKTYHDYAKFSSARRDRNDYWEAIKAHNAVVTSAVFAPNPALVLKQLPKEQDDDSSTSTSDLESSSCYVFVSADFSGIIKVFLLKSKNGASNISPYTN